LSALHLLFEQIPLFQVDEASEEHVGPILKDESGKLLVATDSAVVNTCTMDKIIINGRIIFLVA
jgi:hypothetical protein